MNPTNSVAYQKTEKTKNAARVSAGEKTVRKALNNSAVEKSPAVSSCQMNQSFPGELKWCADEKLVRCMGIDHSGNGVHHDRLFNKICKEINTVSQLLYCK